MPKRTFAGVPKMFACAITNALKVMLTSAPAMGVLWSSAGEPGQRFWQGPSSCAGDVAQYKSRME